MLRCADNTLYTGITNDLPKRLNAHSAGTASKYTRSRRPVSCVYTEDNFTRSEALVREYAIKQLSRAAKEALIMNNSEKSGTL